MKKIQKIGCLLVISGYLICLTSGCNQQAMALSNVRKEFPNCDVAILPDNNKAYEFIIRNSKNEVWYAHNSGLGDNYKSATCLLIRSPKGE